MILARTSFENLLLGRSSFYYTDSWHLEALRELKPEPNTDCLEPVWQFLQRQLLLLRLAPL